jgi:hypothetical protein
MNNKQDNLKKQVKVQEGLHRIYQSQDYQEYLKPILEGVLQSSKWPNPKEYKSEEELLKAYREEYYQMEAYKGLANVLKNAGDTIIKLNDIIKAPKKADGIS